jgi:RNA-directed DNA polymerase
MASQRALRAAYHSLRGKRRARGGVDDVTLEDYEHQLNGRLRDLRERLIRGHFQFSRLRPVAVPKKGSDKFRPILVPTVEDRVVQRAVLHAISKYVRPHVDHPSSHAFLGGPGRGVRSAVTQLCDYLRSGRCCVLLLDIVDFFPSVDADRVIADLLSILPDESLAPLLEQLKVWEIDDLSALPEAQRKCFPGSAKGLPQGSVLSPVLANLYLRGFDLEATRLGVAVVRYADDLAIPCTSVDDARHAHRWVKAYLAALGLAIHEFEGPNQSRKAKLVSGASINLDFLGVNIRGTSRRLARRPSNDSLNRARQMIIETLAPDSRVPLADRYAKLSYFAAGWLASFGQVCDIRSARAAILAQADASLQQLLRTFGLLPPGRALTVRQRRLLGFESLFD